MSDAFWGSLFTTVAVIVVAWLQRSRDKKAKEVLDATHLAVNSNWKAAVAEISELKRLMQAAGVTLPKETP